MSELEELCQECHLSMVELLEGEEPRDDWEPIFIYDKNDELTKLICEEVGINIENNYHETDTI